MFKRELQTAGIFHRSLSIIFVTFSHTWRNDNIHCHTPNTDFKDIGSHSIPLISDMSKTNLPSIRVCLVVKWWLKGSLSQVAIEEMYPPVIKHGKFPNPTVVLYTVIGFNGNNFYKWGIFHCYVYRRVLPNLKKLHLA